VEGVGAELDAGADFADLGACSSTCTSKPWRTSASAAARPPMPPPATSTGKSFVSIAMRHLVLENGKHTY
jgi:hypothetical protein